MNTKVRTVLVDDEPANVKQLKRLLEELCPQVEVVGECNTIIDAMSTLSRMEVDLVFLDIEMPRGLGFKILDTFDNRDFDVIFVTAYSKYAIQAIKRSALDYILKPVDPEELILAVRKVTEKKEQPVTENQNIIIPATNGYEFLDPNIVLYCQAEGSYSLLYSTNKTKRTITLNLKNMESRLPREKFIRIHKSYLVNKQYIAEFSRQGGLQLILTDGTKLPISRRRKEEVLMTLGLA